MNWLLLIAPVVGVIAVIVAVAVGRRIYPLKTATPAIATVGSDSGAAGYRAAGSSEASEVSARAKGMPRTSKF